MSKLLNVSSSPHVRCGVSTKNLMYDVAIAMLPATIWGVMQPPKTMVLSQAKRSLSSARSQPAAEPTLVPAILHRLFLK